MDRGGVSCFTVAARLLDTSLAPGLADDARRLKANPARLNVSRCPMQLEGKGRLVSLTGLHFLCCPPKCRMAHA